jgi:hypothetical protein
VAGIDAPRVVATVTDTIFGAQISVEQLVRSAMRKYPPTSEHRPGVSESPDANLHLPTSGAGIYAGVGPKVLFVQVVRAHCVQPI